MMLKLETSMLFGTSSSGQQKKYWNGDYLIKIDSKYRESKKEVAASVFGRSIGLNVVEYNRIKVEVDGKERNACICRSFLNSGEATITLFNILEFFSVSISQNMSATDYFDIYCRCIDSITHLGYNNISLYLMQILVFDFIIANSDRHLSNIEFITGNGYSRFTPVFDNGKSFFSKDKILTYSELEQLLRKFKYLPFSRNPKRNLIDVNVAKEIGRQYYSRLNFNLLNISDAYKRIIKYRFGLLFNL